MNGTVEAVASLNRFSPHSYATCTAVGIFATAASQRPKCPVNAHVWLIGATCARTPDSQKQQLSGVVGAQRRTTTNTGAARLKENREKPAASRLSSLWLLFSRFGREESSVVIFKNVTTSRQPERIQLRIFSNYNLVTFGWERFGYWKHDGDITLPRAEFPF